MQQRLAVRLQSTEFLQTARHPEYPTAFSRQCKLPLPALLALMLTGGMRMSIQAELDVFFGHLQGQSRLLRTVSEQAFAQARAKPSLTAIPSLNDWLVARADQDGFVPRWCRLRLVAADASTMRFGLRASHVKRAALPNQILFGLFLRGAELMLAASLLGIDECDERQMLVQHLERLSSGDLLLLDCGYPSRWLVSLLKHQSISFCMRVDKAGDGGFACVRDFLRSGLTEQVVTLRAPDRCEAADYDCPREPRQVRLVRHVAPNGNVRVLMTNLFDTRRFPASAFGALYHSCHTSCRTPLGRARRTTTRPQPIPAAGHRNRLPPGSATQASKKTVADCEAQRGIDGYRVDTRSGTLNGANGVPDIPGYVLLTRRSPGGKYGAVLAGTGPAQSPLPFLGGGGGRLPLQTLPAGPGERDGARNGRGPPPGRARRTDVLVAGWALCPL
jgi:hypothetical protein